MLLCRADESDSRCAESGAEEMRAFRRGGDFRRQIMIKKWDAALIAALLALSFIPEGLFLLGNNGAGEIYAAVQVGGKPYREIPLSEHSGRETFTIRTEQGYNQVVVEEQAIAIVSADCPDKICVGEGFISRPGETTVCLPHKVLIEVRSAGGDPDIIPAR